MHIEPAGEKRERPIAERLYLDLLKRSLSNTLFAVEPDVNGDTRRYVTEAIQHYQQSSAVSMLPLARFDNLEYCISEVLRTGVEGDLIETGVWRGGATIFMRACLKVYGDSSRAVWVADSFEGLPEPDPEKYPRESQSYKSAAMTRYYKHLEATLEDVKANFEAYGMLDDQVRFLKGWFSDTLPNAPVEKLAIARLDGDYYESTRDALTNLYDKVSVGGFVIIDDYGEDHWTYCSKAVDEFRAERGITSPLIQVDKPCVYWQKMD